MTEKSQKNSDGATSAPDRIGSATPIDRTGRTKPAKRTNRSASTRGSSKRIAVGAVLSALACVILLIGGVLELLDMTAAAIAAFVVLIACLEYGFRTSLTVYAVSSLLTLILMPTATSTLYYVLLLGYYPIFKLFVDVKHKPKKPIRILLKLLVFNLGCAAVFLLFAKLYGFAAVLSEFEIAGLSPNVFVWIFLAVLNLFLFAYDYLLSVASVLYLKRFRAKKSRRS